MTQEKVKKDEWAVSEESPRYLWMSGKQIEWDKATVHASKLGWSSISMVFEGIRGYWNPQQEQLHIFHLEAHIKRLFQSMKIMRMTSRWSSDDLIESIIKLAKDNEFRDDCYIQPLAYFGDDVPGYLAVVEKPGEIAIISRKASSILGVGRTANAGVSSWSRISDNVMPPRAKAISNYQNSRYVADEGMIRGYEFGIILNQQGKVSEVSYACIYMIRDGVAITPPVTAGILESITRTVVKDLLEHELGVPVVEREMDRTELYIADEVFICGTGAEIQIINNVDGYQIGDGDSWPISSRVEQLYHDIVRGKSGHGEWLTGVY